MIQQTENAQGKTMMDQALAFLQNAITYEQGQELAYFQSHINGNNKLPPEVKNQLSSFFTKTDGTYQVDYIGFIAWINMFFNGINSFKNNLSYESMRLNEVNRLINEFKNLSVRKQNQYRKAAREHSKDKDDDSFYNAFRAFLIDRLNTAKKGNDDLNKAIEAESRSVLNSQTMANAIQDTLKNMFYQTWGDLDIRAKMSELITTKTTSPQTISKELGMFMLNSFVVKASDGISKIILNEVESTGGSFALPSNLKDKLTKEFVDTLKFNEEDERTESLLSEKEIQDLLGRARMFLKDAESQEKTKNRFFKGIDADSIVGHKKGDNGSKQGGMVGLTREVVTILEDALEQELKKRGKTYDWDLKTGKRSGKESIETQRARLLRNLRQLNPQIAVYSSTAHRKLYDYDLVESELHNLINNNNLVTVEIRKKDNIASELGADQAIANTIDTKKLGDKVIALTDGYQKADSIRIDLAEFTATPNIPSGVFSRIADKIVKSFYSTVNVQADVDITGGYNEGADRKEKGFAHNEFFLEGETKRRVGALNKIFSDTKKELEDQGATIDEIKQALDELKKSFQISTTVKSYDKYDNNYGFHGGSLGASVENQVANIQQLIAYGTGSTMSQADIDWLLFAIYNSGSALLGSGVKNQIEDYLSTVAVMLMFDDAGQQAQYVRAQAEGRFIGQSRGILHLYNLNGFFFPSSYILKLTLDGLLRAENYLNSTANYSMGSRAHIINNVGEGDIVGGERSKTTGRMSTTSQQDWFNTFSGNKGKVQIQLTFLAGLLDIMDQLNSYMTQLS